MTITRDEALQRLEAVVAAHGTDYKPSSTCRYFNYRGEPECIIGHAFVDELRAAGVRVGNYNTMAVSVLADRHVLDVDDSARNLLYRAQKEQDWGGTWGVALAQAKLVR